MPDYIKFRERQYATAVRRAIVDELSYVKPYIINNMRNKLGAVSLRRVDAKYQSAMLNSIDADLVSKTNTFLLSIGAGGKATGQNQSFRAVYYEYGTGNKMQPPSGWSQQSSGRGSWNSARKGRDIYQRPFGKWTDLGGNDHISRLKGSPKKLADTPGTLGEEIPASHWFKQSMVESIPLIDNAIRKAVNSVPISAYIDLRSIKKRM